MIFGLADPRTPFVIPSSTSTFLLASFFKETASLTVDDKPVVLLGPVGILFNITSFNSSAMSPITRSMDFTPNFYQLIHFKTVLP